jgi:hypothetical protein
MAVHQTTSQNWLIHKKLGCKYSFERRVMLLFMLIFHQLKWAYFKWLIMLASFSFKTHIIGQYEIGVKSKITCEQKREVSK